MTSFNDIKRAPGRRSWLYWNYAEETYNNNKYSGVELVCKARELSRARKVPNPSAWIRRKLRQQGFARQILPPTKVV